jgi:hypothetical protein
MISQIVLSTHSRFQLLPCCIQAHFFKRDSLELKVLFFNQFLQGPFPLTESKFMG